MTDPSPSPGTPQISARLVSLDALRGFDMCLIAGGDRVLRAIAEAIGPDAHAWMLHQTEHPEWNGYTPWDQIFPLFMFVSGVAMPFSFAKRLQVDGAGGRAALHIQVIRRGLLLVLLGLIYQGLLTFDFENLRYPSVLGRIGLGYMFAGLIVLNTKLRGQIIAALALLGGYWAAMKFIPVPGFGPGDWEPGHTLADYLDRQLLPGKLYQRVRDPEGLLSTVPSIATVLTGVFAGRWLRTEAGGLKKTFGLLAAGLGGVVAGALCDPWFPINKNLWTSSFVLWTSGWSAILLAVFYLVIDVWGCRRWAFAFVVIGVNPITIYLAGHFIDFRVIGETVFAPAANHLHPTIFSGAQLFTGWLFLYVLYRQRIFLKV